MASQQDLRGGWFMVGDLTPAEGPVEMGSEMASTRKITKQRGLWFVTCFCLFVIFRELRL